MRIQSKQRSIYFVSQSDWRRKVLLRVARTRQDRIRNVAEARGELLNNTAMP